MKNLIIKKLIQRVKNSGGRSAGRITAPRRGGFSRKLYRFVDFKRELFPGVLATVARLDIDPNRNCYLALMVFPEGCLNYIIAPESLKLGQKLINVSNGNRQRVGDSLALKNISSGSLIYNLTSSPKIPGQYIRAAGNSAILVKTNNAVSLVKLKSGEYRYFYSESLGVLGKVNNGEYFLKSWRLAGKSRRLGIRPRNRALARNPVDHPMGGRTKGGTPKLTPKGRVCLNTETRLKRNKLVIIKAREKKKI